MSFVVITFLLLGCAHWGVLRHVRMAEPGELRPDLGGERVVATQTHDMRAPHASCRPAPTLRAAELTSEIESDPLFRWITPAGWIPFTYKWSVPLSQI